jgi:hypothetical protein
MPRTLVTKLQLTKHLNEEIQRRLGDAEGCSVTTQQIGSKALDTDGCNWGISGWFRSSRPSGNTCEAIVKAATAKLQKLYNLKSVVQ